MKEIFQTKSIRLLEFTSSLVGLVKLITPFYIGSSLNIRLRLCQHLKEKTFWGILEGRTVNNFELDKGYKYFHFGYLRQRGRQDPKRCIIVIEKQMIRQKIQEGVHLLNQRGTTIPTHTIQFEGRPIGFSSFAKQTEIAA